MPDLRRLLRRSVNRVCALATAPLRAVATAAVTRRPGLAPWLAEWSWLWQPNWGKAMHRSLFGSTADPYNTASSPYEQQKYRDILEVLGDRTVGRALEIGCSEGVFTAMLAEHCDELLAVDIADIAVARARERLAGHPHVRVERRTLPFDHPPGPFDLVVCSDVLYLWQPSVLDLGLRTIVASLRPGGLLLLQHYLGRFGAPVDGETVHELAARQQVDGTALRVLASRRRADVNPHGTGGAGYRIELLQHPG